MKKPKKNVIKTLKGDFSFSEDAKRLNLFTQLSKEPAERPSLCRILDAREYEWIYLEIIKAEREGFFKDRPTLEKEGVNKAFYSVEMTDKGRKHIKTLTKTNEESQVQHQNNREKYVSYMIVLCVGVLGVVMILVAEICLT